MNKISNRITAGVVGLVLVLALAAAPVASAGTSAPTGPLASLSELVATWWNLLIGMPPVDTNTPQDGDAGASTDPIG